MWLASAADAKAIGQILLGNHGILTQQGEDLLFTLSHRQTSICKRLSIIAGKRLLAISLYKICRLAHKKSTFKAGLASGLAGEGTFNGSVALQRLIMAAAR